MLADLSDHLALPLVSVGICALRGAGAMFISKASAIFSFVSMILHSSVSP